MFEKCGNAHRERSVEYGAEAERCLGRDLCWQLCSGLWKWEKSIQHWFTLTRRLQGSCRFWEQIYVCSSTKGTTALLLKNIINMKPTVLFHICLCERKDWSMLVISSNKTSEFWGLWKPLSGHSHAFNIYKEKTKTFLFKTSQLFHGRFSLCDMKILIQWNVKYI